ncbi:MAG: type IX secretion system membrane protein PorP/SprF [Bacteroidales bacterium]|nr:type IX secretion system membrane protein PorP/SprF [Bacteroidales bacterium]
MTTPTTNNASNMNNRYIFILSLLGLFFINTLKVSAQQDPLFSQYMFNKLAVNPGYAGSRDVLTLDALYRYQWVNIQGAPQTVSASVHSPLNNPHLGVGLNVYHDAIGPSINQGAMATFSYKILFPNSKLSFGIQAGYKYTDVLWSRIVTGESNDPLLTAPMQNKAVPDAAFGIYYYSNKYYVGFSSKQLLQNQMGIVSVNGKEEFTKLLRHFYGMAGAAFKVSDQVVFRPSVLVKFVQNAPPQMDLNASFQFAGTFWVGASYRTEKALSLMTEFNVSDNLRVGYSYDIWFNELLSSNSGSHEIRLGFDFDIFKRRMVSPRYF